MPNATIRDLPPVTIPIDVTDTFLEVSVLEANEEVSRRVAASDLVVGGITIEDEGVPLATLATTLNFVGAGVTASGVGATKTITIPGAGAGSLAGLTDVDLTGQAIGDLLFNVDGTNWNDTAGRLTYTPGTLTLFDAALTDSIALSLDGTDATFVLTNISALINTGAASYDFITDSVGGSDDGVREAPGASPRVTEDGRLRVLEPATVNQDEVDLDA